MRSEFAPISIFKEGDGTNGFGGFNGNGNKEKVRELWESRVNGNGATHQEQLEAIERSDIEARLVEENKIGFLALFPDVEELPLHAQNEIEIVDSQVQLSTRDKVRFLVMRAYFSSPGFGDFAEEIAEHFKGIPQQSVRSNLKTLTTEPIDRTLWPDFDKELTPWGPLEEPSASEKQKNAIRLYIRLRGEQAMQSLEEPLRNVALFFDDNPEKGVLTQEDLRMAFPQFTPQTLRTYLSRAGLKIQTYVNQFGIKRLTDYSDYQQRAVSLGFFPGEKIAGRIYTMDQAFTNYKENEQRKVDLPALYEKLEEFVTLHRDQVKKDEIKSRLGIENDYHYNLLRKKAEEEGKIEKRKTTRAPYWRPQRISEIMETVKKLAPNHTDKDIAATVKQPLDLVRATLRELRRRGKLGKRSSSIRSHHA